MASIQNQLDKILLKKVKLSNGKTVEQNLMEAVDYLYMCIQKHIDAMYEGYTPTYYERRPFHSGLRSALYVEDFLDARIVGNTVQISLKFSSNVWAWNFNHTHKSPVNVLMQMGWRRSDAQEPVSHDINDRSLQYYEGYDFIGKGIDDFNRNNRWDVTILKPIIDESNWY